MSRHSPSPHSPGPLVDCLSLRRQILSDTKGERGSNSGPFGRDTRRCTLQARQPPWEGRRHSLAPSFLEANPALFFLSFPRDVLHRLKQLMRLSEKKYHTFLMGKINPAKLSNFTEVDIYTIVACPETSLVRVVVDKHH